MKKQGNTSNSGVHLTVNRRSDGRGTTPIDPLRITSEHYLGANSELLAAAYFVRHGWQVYWPTIQQSCIDFVIEKARGEEIPVVFYNKEPSAADLASYDKAYYVGTDSKESGIIQGQLIAKHWKAHPEWDLNKDGVIQFVLLKGEPGHPDAEARTTYVVKTLNDGGVKTEQLHMDTGMWDTAMAKDKMDAWISGPNANKIEVVIANNDGMAMGAVESLKAQGKTAIPVFGVDALPEALAMVKSGAMAGTVLNDAANQAKATFELTKNLAEGKPAGEGTNWKIDNKVVRVAYVGVDKDNLSQFE